MKKFKKRLKRVMAALLRCLILFTPGVAFLVFALSAVPALFAVLAAFGVEAVYLFLFALVLTVIEAVRKAWKGKELQEAPPA